MKNLFFALIALSLTNAVHAEILSQNSSIANKNCVVISSDQLDENPEIDHYTAECAGLGGYQVFVTGGDLRYNLQIKHFGKEIQLPVPPSFHTPSKDFVEWRVTRANNQINYTAMIYALNISSYNSQSGQMKDKEVFFVVRLLGPESCVIGFFADQKDPLTKARQLADSPSNRCI